MNLLNTANDIMRNLITYLLTYLLTLILLSTDVYREEDHFDLYFIILEFYI